MPAILLNDIAINCDASPGLLVLDFIRTRQRLPGTRSACREGDCGSCLILSGQLNDGRMHYHALNSCLLPLGSVQGAHVVTIEGLNGEVLSPIQRALVEHGAIQCGFCTPGLVIALTAWFLNAGSSALVTAMDAVSGNLCRCTGYAGIKRAVTSLVQQFDLAGSLPKNRITDLIEWQILPAYFAAIPQRLANLTDSGPEDNASSDNKQTTPTIIIAGGTDLVVQSAASLVDHPLHFIPSNESIHLEERWCLINASTRIETVRTSPQLAALLPNISDDLKAICSPAVRQQATIGGNLVNGSPIADLAVFFLALDASLDLSSSGQSRRVALRDFFRGYKQLDLKAGEQLESIRFYCPETPLRFSFEKVSKRHYLDIASVNSAMLLEIDQNVIREIHISAGGVAAVPLYLERTCDWLKQKPISASVIKEALQLSQTEISPIDDIRGSEKYKRLLLKQLLLAHFLKLLPEQLSWEALR